ncbi:hypothetical protein HMPREF1548_06963 [Clostridium sp. KLE 1755]|nr:hypothetical protein HMPREF1548_06963 [Clostridium sp. KLE 1755]
MADIDSLIHAAAPYKKISLYFTIHYLQKANLVTVQPSAELLLHPPMISRLRRGADACCHHVFSRFVQ